MTHVGMNKEKMGFQKEYFLKTASVHSIWNQVSTSRGLSEWFAPRVDITQNTIHIFWDEVGDDRMATITKREVNKMIEWRWDDDPDSYVRMEIISLELSNSSSLIVEDFDKGLDSDTLERIWEVHEERLYSSLGIL